MPDANGGAPAHKGIEGFLKESTAGLPNWAWLLVIAGGIAAAYFVPKLLSGFNLFGGSSQSAGATPGGTSATPTDTSGLLTVPQGQTPILPQGIAPLYSPAGDLTAYGQTPPATATTTSPAPTTTTPTSYVAQLRSAVTHGYGAGGTSIPIRDTPGGNVVGQLPLNGQIQITGSPMTGSNNFGTNAPAGIGSTDWYPIAGGGFISGFDIANVNNMPIGPSIYIPNWPGNTQQIRVT